MCNGPPRHWLPETATVYLLMILWARPWSGLSWGGWSPCPHALTRVRLAGLSVGTFSVPQVRFPHMKAGFPHKAGLHSQMTSFLPCSIGQGKSEARPDRGSGEEGPAPQWPRIKLDVGSLECLSHPALANQRKASFSLPSPPATQLKRALLVGAAGMVA